MYDINNAVIFTIGSASTAPAMQTHAVTQAMPITVEASTMIWEPDAALPLLGVPLATDLLKLGCAHLSLAVLHTLGAHQQNAAAPVAGDWQHLRPPFWQRHQLHCLWHLHTTVAGNQQMPTAWCIGCCHWQQQEASKHTMKEV